MANEKRVLLLCFIHGFKGGDNTFRDFPQHLKSAVADKIPDDIVETIVYPKYETKGELTQSTAIFLTWLKEKVIDVRKKHLETAWPPNDRRVGVILVAHSMGGFIASDTLFRILDERREDTTDPSTPLFPLIQGILAFDTPYNGLARSMFVYGAFSNYQKVSNVFSTMTALSAAAPGALSRLATRRAASTAASTAVRSRRPAWKAWQLVAVRTGTVGAIAAGGVAAYMHRKEIMAGVRTVRGWNRESVVQGYHQGMDALGQGLAYVNKGNVGQSFAWLSDHLTFVGALMKQNELNQRLSRLAALRGVGIHDIYVSMGENGYWSGGYFVPERTFCAVPANDQPAASLFTRHVVEDATDEIVAHTNLFKPEMNKGYETMTTAATNRIIAWFQDNTELYDEPAPAVALTSDEADEKSVDKAVQEAEAMELDENEPESNDAIPDASPIDIAAAASLPEDADAEELTGEEHEAGGDETQKAAAEEKKAYLAYLYGIAQQAGTSARSYIPSQLPKMDMPSMPKVPSMTMPSLPIFSKPGAKASQEKVDEAKESAPAEKEKAGDEKKAEVTGEQ